MSYRSYALATGVIFLVIAVLHLLRVIFGWDATGSTARNKTALLPTGQLQEGSYYLVLRDTSLGILSAPASDITLKVQLNP